MSDMLGAMLLAQLEARADIQASRKRIWERYRTELLDWATGNDVRLPIVPLHCAQTFHLFYLLFSSLERRTAFIDHLAKAQIKAVFHYQPLHLSPMGQRFGSGRVGDCPVTERAADVLV